MYTFAVEPAHLDNLFNGGYIEVYAFKRTVFIAAHENIPPLFQGGQLFIVVIDKFKAIPARVGGQSLVFERKADF